MGVRSCPLPQAYAERTQGTRPDPEPRWHPDAEGAGRSVPDLAFCPTSDITVETAPQFLALPNVRICGGSWLTPEAQALRG